LEDESFHTDNKIMKNLESGGLGHPAMKPQYKSGFSNAANAVDK